MYRGRKKKKGWMSVFPLLFAGFILFSIIFSPLNLLSKVNAERVYTEEYEDPYGDVLYYDEVTDTIKSTDKKPHIDIKECQVGNNNATLFVRIDFWGSVKDANGVIYHCYFDTTSMCTGPYYENGVFHDSPVIGYKNNSSMFFEIPISYLEEKNAIWNGSILKIGIMTEELSDEHYTENLEKKIYYNLTNYREQEPYPRAYIEYISPNPGVYGENVSFSGYGVTLANASIVEYEWAEYDCNAGQHKFLSNQSSFTMGGFDECFHYIYFRVKDNNSNWSKQIVELLNIKVPETERPVIEILSPSEDEKVKGIVTFSYKATAKEGRFIEKVEMKIGNGNWFTIFSSDAPSGSDYYNYTWDSTTMGDGYHPIWLKAYDGKYYSTADAVMVYVDNDNVKDNGENGGILNQLQQNKTLIIPLIIILGILICLIVIKVKIKKRKKLIDEGMI